MGLIQTHVYLDFDNDLDFNDANEDISRYVTNLVIQRGTDETLNASSLELQVLDTDGRFQPQFSGGPYGSGLMLGRRVKVAMGLGSLLSTWDEINQQWEKTAIDWDTGYDQYYGFLTEIAPEYIAVEEQEPLRSLIAADLLRMLEIRKITTGTLIDQTTGEIIDLLLDNLGWEPGIFTLDRSYLDSTALLGGATANWRHIDDGRTTIPYCQWDNAPVASAIREVLAAEHGNFYVGKDGWVHYEDRHHRPGDRTSLATLTDEHISEMVVRYTDEDLFNHVEVVAHPRSVGSAASVVFNAIGDNDGHRLTPDESREYYVSYTDPETGRICEVTDIVTPVSGTDYIANSLADGTGSDRTADLDVTFAADDNDRYKFTVVNDGSTDLYLTTLQLRATPLVAYDAVTMTATDDVSIAQYLQRDMNVNNTLLNNPTEAQDYASWLLHLHKDPHARIERLVLMDSNWYAALQIVNREISDRVTINSNKYNVNGDFFIDGISIEADSAGGQVRCEWMLSGLAADTLFFTLDADTLDSEAILGY